MNQLIFKPKFTMFGVLYNTAGRTDYFFKVYCIICKDEEALRWIVKYKSSRYGGNDYVIDTQFLVCSDECLTYYFLEVM